MPPRPRNDPAWYHSQACFYIFNFGIEIIVVYLYVLVRVDRRFHIPNGSKGPGDYSGTSVLESEKQKSTGESSGGGARIMSEEEVFDDKEHEDVRFEDGRHNQDLERGSA